MRKIIFFAIALLALYGCEKSLNLCHVDSYKMLPVPKDLKKGTPEFDEWFEREVHRQFTPKGNAYNAGACTFYLSAEDDKLILSVENNTENELKIWWDYVFYNADQEMQTCEDTLRVVTKENRPFEACKKIGAGDKITAYLAPKGGTIKKSLRGKNNFVLTLDYRTGENEIESYTYKFDFDFSLLKSGTSPEGFTLLENYKPEEEKKDDPKNFGSVSDYKFEIVTAEP